MRTTQKTLQKTLYQTGKKQLKAEGYNDIEHFNLPRRQITSMKSMIPISRDTTYMHGIFKRRR
jgi:hypothetical protein